MVVKGDEDGQSTCDCRRDAAALREGVKLA